MTLPSANKAQSPSCCLCSGYQRSSTFSSCCMVDSGQRTSATLGHLSPVPTVSYPFRLVTIPTAQLMENSLTRSESVAIVVRLSSHNEFQTRLKGAAADPEVRQAHKANRFNLIYLILS